MLLLCAKIFFARILDVSLGTVRTILLVKSKRLEASIVAFVEVIIWFLIVKEAIALASDSPWIIVAYAGGFTAGTYIGSILSDKYIEGSFTVQVICPRNENLIELIRNSGFGITVVDVKGRDRKDKKVMMFIEIDKHDYPVLERIIKTIEENAFIVVNETRLVQNGYFAKKK